MQFRDKMELEQSSSRARRDDKDSYIRDKTSVIQIDCVESDDLLNNHPINLLWIVKWNDIRISIAISDANGMMAI